VPRDIKALENEINRLNRAVKELSILNDIAIAICSAQNIENILELVIKKSIKHMNVEQGAVMLLKDRQQGNSFTTIFRRGETTLNKLPLHLDVQLTGWMRNNNKPLLINNLKKDDRFYGLIDYSEIESILAVPLSIKGRMIGLISLFNKRNKSSFAEEDQRLLSIIASQSAQVIENARLAEEEKKLREMEEELNLAYRIQTNLLPKEPPVLEKYDIASVSIPAKVVGGDYYDFIRINESRLAFCIGDISGKGMPAALLMSNLQAMVHSQITEFDSPAAALERFNHLIFQSTPPEKYVTFFLGIIDLTNNELRFSNAGHHYPILITSDGKITQLEINGIVLGILESQHFEERTIQLNQGNLIVLYTDGVTEATNQNDEEFGIERLMNTIINIKDKPSEEIISGTLATIKSFIDTAPQADDITLVIIKRDS
jgi:sigma-B regulation protein RsbU (phosphoserine phosphatase)